MIWRPCQKAMITPRPDSQNARTRSAWSVRSRKVAPSARISAYPKGGSIVSFSQSHISDRKSTRLNSSHLVISYAVFCLKKKKRTHKTNYGDNIRQHTNR